MDESQGKLDTSLANMHTLASREPDWKTCRDCKEDFGGLDASGRCGGCHDAIERSKVAKVEAEALRTAHETRLVSLLGGQRAYDEFRLETYRWGPGTALVSAAVSGFVPEADNLYVWGSAGIGKTHLAYAVARRFMVPGSIEAAVYKVPRLLRWFRRRDPSEEEAEIIRLSALRVLVLDDLGVEKDTEHAMQMLYEIIDSRDMNKRNGLIITSNLDPDTLAKKMGDDRLPSRIFGLCRVLELTGQDERMKKHGEPL